VAGDRTCPDEGWEQRRLEQLRAFARRTTPAQRLAWLEEAMRIALHSGALERERAARARYYDELWRTTGPSTWPRQEDET
jgi:hypothetical protein